MSDDLFTWYLCIICTFLCGFGDKGIFISWLCYCSKKSKCLFGFSCKTLKTLSLSRLFSKNAENKFNIYRYQILLKAIDMQF